MSSGEGLTEVQEGAARHNGSHAVLIAGPGTGKTRVMAARVQYLVSQREVPTNQILAVTFTRAAARELRERVGKTLSGIAPQVSTLHSYALSVLVRLDPERLPIPIRVADDYDEKEIIWPDLRRRLALKNKRQVEKKLRDLAAGWETTEAKDSDYFDRYPDPEFTAALEEHRSVYQYTLRAELVFKLLQALEEGRVPRDGLPDHVLVDEYQDLNPCDLAVVRMLGDGATELFAAGDDDQSIYGFRYADPQAIGRFTKDFTPSVRLDLEECHRCAPAIVEYSAHVLRGDLNRVQKRLRAARTTPPGVVRVSHFPDGASEANGVARIAQWLHDARGVPWGEIVVLLRADSGKRVSRPLEQAMTRRGVPVSVAQDPLAPLDSRPGRAVLSALELLIDPEDHLAWRSLLTCADNRISESAVLKLHDLARERGITFVAALRDVVRRPDTLPRGDRIAEMTTGFSGFLERGHALRSDARKALTEVSEHLVSRSSGAAAVHALFARMIDETADGSLDSVLRHIRTDLREPEQVPDCVRVLSMHGAKGLTAQSVIVAAVEDEFLPADHPVSEERRLLYVSLTRAKEYLFVLWSRKREGSQQFTGSRRGVPVRRLTRFLQGGLVRPVPGDRLVASLGD